jgi:hypothetical protein
LRTVLKRVAPSKFAHARPAPSFETEQHRRRRQRADDLCQAMVTAQDMGRRLSKRTRAKERKSKTASHYDLNSSRRSTHARSHKMLERGIDPQPACGLGWTSACPWTIDSGRTIPHKATLRAGQGQ